MAQSDATVTGDFSGFINPEQSEAIFDQVRKSSVVQQLVRRVPLSYRGVEVPVTTSKPTAGWVSEAGQKPASEGGKTLKTMTPKKIAAISVVSAEVIRANPGGYIEDLKADIAEAFAIAFDAAALHGTSTPFGAGSWIAGTTKQVELGTATQANGGVFKDINSGLSLLVAAGKRLTGFAFGDIAEPIFNSATETTGRPLFIDSPTVETAGPVRAGRMLGRPSFYSSAVQKDEYVGFGGDWSQAAWGVVGGITYDVSTEATVTLNGSLVSLFENNLVAIRAEAEYGWLLNDQAAFVRYVEADYS